MVAITLTHICKQDQITHPSLAIDDPQRFPQHVLVGINRTKGLILANADVLEHHIKSHIVLDITEPMPSNLPAPSAGRS